MYRLIAILLCLVSTICFADQDEIATARLAGDIGQFALPLSALTLSLADNKIGLTSQLAKSMGTTLGIAYSLKFMVNEKRPNGGDYSFPSGHTSAAFAGASFIQGTYGWKWGIPAYSAATFVGWSRVESRAHWIQDVVAGAALGITVNQFFTSKKRKSPIIFQVQPDFSARGNLGINASYSW